MGSPTAPAVKETLPRAGEKKAYGSLASSCSAGSWRKDVQEVEGLWARGSGLIGAGGDGRGPGG